MADSDILKFAIQLGVVGKEDAAALRDLFNETKASAAGLAKEMGVIEVSGSQAAKILAANAGKAKDLREALELVAKTRDEAIQSAAIGESLSAAEAEARQAGLAPNRAVTEAAFHHNFGRTADQAEDRTDAVRDPAARNQTAVDDSADSKRREIAVQEIEQPEQRGAPSHAAALKMKQQLDVEYEHRRVIQMMATDRFEEAKATDAVTEGGAQVNLGLSQAQSSLSQDQGLASLVESGQPVGAADAKKLIDDASRIAGHQVDLQTAAKMIEAGANNMGAFMDQVNRLAVALARFSPADQQQFNQRLQTLEAVVARNTANSNLH
jgi:hypothetical protein